MFDLDSNVTTEVDNDLIDKNKELGEVLRFQQDTIQDQAMRIEVSLNDEFYSNFSPFIVYTFEAFMPPDLPDEGDVRQPHESV